MSTNPRNSDLIFPMLNGKEINSRLDHSPERWALTFYDWPLERAKEYPECMNLVLSRIKPERDKIEPTNPIAKQRRDLWWKYSSPTVELYRAARKLKRVLARSRVSGLHMVAWVRSDILYNDAVVVFAFDDDASFGVLQSSIHEAWLAKYASTLKSDVRYKPRECFGCFGFPKGDVSDLLRIGHTYADVRKGIIARNQEGLTKIYNHFNDPNETRAEIDELRERHVEMDNAVAAAYGWTDLDLGHGFHETKQGVRYTISEAARREVLSRLLKLNHERYAEEVRQGLHDKKKTKAAKGKKKAGAVLSGCTLFDRAETNTDVWYFAYGSNLWIDQKQKRTGPIRSGDERPRVARLADYRLAFNKQGGSGEVYANIMPCRGAQVIGVAYRCSPATLDTMSEFEGGYERQVVAVVLDDGASIEAVTYVALKGSVVDDACPSKSYLDRILRGAEQHGLPPDYIEKIKLLASACEGDA